MIQAGKLRHKISIQSKASTRNGYNEVDDTWSTDFTTRASITPLSGRELTEAQQVNSEVTHKVVTRYREPVSSAQRILFGSRIFHIVSVINPEERNGELQITAIERL